MEYSAEYLIERSRKLAYYLRHDKDYEYEQGSAYRSVSDLIENHGYTFDLLETLVVTDSKGRYMFSGDRTKIKATYGHSKWIKVEYAEALPPDLLYHGTVSGFLPKIQETGIKPMSRTHVHMSTDIVVAKDMGMRHKKHGDVRIIVIDSRQMSADGVKFYMSGGDLWLTDCVAPKYFVDIVQ